VCISSASTLLLTYIHSFPTRRSSDLMFVTKCWNVKGHLEDHMHHIDEAAQLLRKGEVVAFPTETVYGLGADATNEGAVGKATTRSEEHTSELQSRFDLVCRLLLEKKK